jgi:transcriptional regulator with XRE-family HTH domain
MSNKILSDEKLQELRDRIKARRLFLDLTYQELADKTGMSKSTLQRYETGQIKNLPYEKLFVLSEALEVPANYFTDFSKTYTLNFNENNLSNSKSMKNIIAKFKEFENLAVSRITPKLLQKGYKVELEPAGALGDILAIKGKEFWYIDFKFINSIIKYPTGSGMQTQDFYMRLGRLASYQGSVTKYSLLLDNKNIGYDFIDKFNKIRLNVDVSIIFLTDDGFEEVFFNKQ